MSYFKEEIRATRDEVISMLSDNDRVNSNVTFEGYNGTPRMKLVEKKGRIRITCEFVGRNKRDNGFLVGTYFTGKVKERADGVSVISGHILTAPIYHLVILALIIVFIVQCFRVGGFSVIPIFICIFDIFLFKDEFKKRGLIRRYILRGLSRMSKDKKQ